MDIAVRCPILYNVTTDQKKVLHISYIKSYQAILNYIIAQKAQKVVKNARRSSSKGKQQTSIKMYTL